MTDIEKAARQVLEALEKALRYHGVMLLSDPPQDAWKYHRVEQTAHEAITALSRALEGQSSVEQPAQQKPFGHGGRPMTLRECMEAEEPSQAEPVAWATQLGEYAHIQWGAKRPEYPMVYEFPLYTRPQAREPQEPVECMCGICKLGKREPLTDEEICRIGAQVHVFLLCNEGQWGIEMARAIEAAHGIKGDA